MPGRMLYELREVHLWQRGRRYIVTVDGEQEPRGESENPIEAWTLFIDTLDLRVRRRIGDMLERQGKNRFTGLAEGKEEKGLDGTGENDSG